jgi:hypothetical protein
MATVDELVSQIRQQTDEANTTDLSDSEIIQVLDRAQRNAINIITRRFPDLFYTSTDLTTVSGQYDYDIPKEAVGRKIAHVECYVDESAYPLQRIDISKTSYYRSQATTTRPRYFGLTKNTLQLYPAPSGGLTVTVYYPGRVEPLVLNQGRVTYVNSGTNTIAVDTLGSSLSTTTTGFGSYVNFIDYRTGAIKGTCQINSINTTLKEISFKTTGLTRSTVLDKTVAVALPTDLEVDDYICLITGTCVPELDEGYSDFLIQYSVVDIKRRFGEPLQEELESLKRLQDEIEKTWTGRNQAGRVRKSNSIWGTYT